MQATGAPGGLAALDTYSRHESTTVLRSVDGVARVTVSLGRLLRCPAVAQASGGAATVAGLAGFPSARRLEAEIRVRVRDAGGAFGPTVTLADVFTVPAAAIAPSGAAVVARVSGDDDSRSL